MIHKHMNTAHNACVYMGRTVCIKHCDKSKALWMRFDSVWFDFRQLGLKFVDFFISTIIIRLDVLLRTLQRNQWLKFVWFATPASNGCI